MIKTNSQELKKFLEALQSDKFQNVQVFLTIRLLADLAYQIST